MTTMRPLSPSRSLLDLLAQPSTLQGLPSLRTILRDLEEKTNYQQVSIQDISKVIRHDQSLSVRLLRLANSGYFSLGQPIMDLDEAILYLGLNNVRTVIFTSRCIETTSAIRSPHFSWAEFWKHSAAVASMTRMLASRIRQDGNSLPAESFYLMGLMHDIGKLVLALLVPREFENALRISATTERPLHSVEIELLGADHAQVGAWYLQKQGVPTQIADAVRLHHVCHLDGSKSRNSLLLFLANELVRKAGIGKSGDGSVVSQSPLESSAFLELVSNSWEPAEDVVDARRLIEDELALLPDLVKSITE
jgi:HD-like signal output (HDOD) protein